MPHFLDIFKFTLHSELEALERDLTQHVSERILKEGDAFPGQHNSIVAKVEIDLDKVAQKATSVRSIEYEEK